VRDGCVHCDYVGAALNNFNGHVKYGEQSATDVRIRGYTPSMAIITDTDLESGRFLTDTDLNTASAVAIIGHDIWDNLMPGTDPIGKEINVDGKFFTVIGIGTKQGKTLGQSRDNWVIIPISTFQRIYGAHQSINISAKAHEVGDPMEQAMDEARVILRSRRHDLPGKPDSFSLEDNSTFLSLWSNLSGTFFMAMVAIASISLVVGGIVIMNIMLVSVTERTREIGVRKALGARRGDVMRQFLIESGTMALVGGALGVVLGATIAKTITLLIGMPSQIKFWSVLAGLLVSTFVGVFFGVYPARRAAMLDPIVALRSEL
jgi:putative ABC transport system permease protein